MLFGLGTIPPFSLKANAATMITVGTGADGIISESFAEVTNVTATGTAATNFSVKVQEAGNEDAKAVVYGNIYVPGAANYILIG
jgi:hypothetical protein